MSEEILDIGQAKPRKYASAWKHGIVAGVIAAILSTCLQYLSPLIIFSYQEENLARFKFVYWLHFCLSFAFFLGPLLYVMFRMSISYLFHPSAFKKVMVTGLIAYQTILAINILISFFLAGPSSGFSWDTMHIILAVNIGIVVASIPITWLPSKIPYFRKQMEP